MLSVPTEDATQVTQTDPKLNNKKSKRHMQLLRTKRLRLIMNVSHCRYEVVRDVAKEQFKMRLVEEDHLGGG